MKVRNQSQMNRLRTRTYGSVTLLGLAATAWLTHHMDQIDSAPVQKVTSCQQTIGRAERMHCAWQQPGVISRLMVDPQFDKRQASDKSSSEFSFAITDPNVYETDKALASDFEELNTKREHDSGMALTVGLAGTLVLNLMTSIPLIRRQEWDASSQQMLYS